MRTTLPMSSENSYGRKQSRCAGSWVGARGFHAHPTPQTACSVIGTAPRVPMQTHPKLPGGPQAMQRPWTRLPGFRRNFFCVWCTRSSTGTVCSVWLQELSRSARCRNGARPPAARQRPPAEGPSRRPRMAENGCSPAAPTNRRDQPPPPVRPISATLRRYSVGSFS